MQRAAGGLILPETIQGTDFTEKAFHHLVNQQAEIFKSIEVALFVLFTVTKDSNEFMPGR